MCNGTCLLNSPTLSHGGSTIDSLFSSGSIRKEFKQYTAQVVKWAMGKARAKGEILALQICFFFKPQVCAMADETSSTLELEIVEGKELLAAGMQLHARRTKLISA